MSLCIRRNGSVLRQLRHFQGIMPLRAKILDPRFQALRGNTMSTTAQQSDEEPDTVFYEKGGNRTALLNRPKKLNSLNLSMIQKLLPRLSTWEKSDMAKTILLKGAGEKAFCAGGDVAALVTFDLPDPDELLAARKNYFRHEYTLDYYISTYPKPIIAIMDGITMGGGVGLSINAPFRIATEKTIFAMPETLIGFFPDVGATYFLPRLDGELGIYLGLTGHQLRGYDVVWAGIATHYIPSERFPALEARLAEVNSDSFKIVNSILCEFENRPPAGYTFTISPTLQNAIDRIFAYSDLSRIMAALEREASSGEGEVKEWAISTIDVLKQRSPTSLHVSLAAMRAGLDKFRFDIFQREFELATRFMQHPDFVEGVSARLIRREKPVWSLGPAALTRRREWVEKNIIVAGGFEKTLDESFYILQEVKKYPRERERSLYEWSLPMEAGVCAVLMRGKVDGSRGQAAKFTRQEFVEFLVGERPQKAGLEKKLNAILNRKTIEDAMGKLVWNFEAPEVFKPEE